jgi:hypothetical protein
MRRLTPFPELLNYPYGTWGDSEAASLSLTTLESRPTAAPALRLKLLDSTAASGEDESEESDRPLNRRRTMSGLVWPGRQAL